MTIALTWNGVGGQVVDLSAAAQVAIRVFETIVIDTE
jgi:hypothetical protein